jgi:hypothetical protein
MKGGGIADYGVGRVREEGLEEKEVAGGAGFKGMIVGS